MTTLRMNNPAKVGFDFAFCFLSDLKKGETFCLTLGTEFVVKSVSNYTVACSPRRGWRGTSERHVTTVRTECGKTFGKGHIAGCLVWRDQTGVDQGFSLVEDDWPWVQEKMLTNPELFPELVA